MKALNNFTTKNSEAIIKIFMSCFFLCIIAALILFYLRIVL